MPALFVFGDTEAAHDPGSACPRSGQSSGQVGVEEEALDELGTEPAQGRGESDNALKGSMAVQGQGFARDAGLAENLDHGAGPHQTKNAGVPTLGIEPCRQRYKSAFRASGVQVRDNKREPDRPARPSRLGES